MHFSFSTDHCLAAYHALIIFFSITNTASNAHASRCSVPAPTAYLATADPVIFGLPVLLKVLMWGLTAHIPSLVRSCNDKASRICLHCWRPNIPANILHFSQRKTNSTSWYTERLFCFQWIFLPPSLPPPLSLYITNKGAN